MCLLLNLFIIGYCLIGYLYDNIFINYNDIGWFFMTFVILLMCNKQTTKMRRIRSQTLEIEFIKKSVIE